MFGCRFADGVAVIDVLQSSIRARVAGQSVVRKLGGSIKWAAVLG